MSELRGKNVLLAFFPLAFTSTCTAELCAMSEDYGQFQRGTTVWQAQDADDHILYDSSTGNLYFDADGNGAIAPQLFATLHEGLDLTAADFIVI